MYIVRISLLFTHFTRPQKKPPLAGGSSCSDSRGERCFRLRQKPRIPVCWTLDHRSCSRARLVTRLPGVATDAVEGVKGYLEERNADHGEIPDKSKKGLCHKRTDRGRGSPDSTRITPTKAVLGDLLSSLAPFGLQDTDIIPQFPIDIHRNLLGLQGIVELFV